MKYTLVKSFDYHFIKTNSLILLKNGIKIIPLYLPSYFFYKLEKYSESFLFCTYFFYKFFTSHFFLSYSNLLNIYYLKIKIKGLGYRIKKITNQLYKFYFNMPNFFYFHVPKSIIFKIKGKKLFFLGMDFCQLRIILVNFFLLKKLIPYRVRGIYYPRQILVLKPGKKPF